jgi:dipeptidyl aminopeptidase/acylaminoacyl peptidase
MIGDVAVTNRLSIAYFSSHLNMVIVSVDGRGTGFRGNKFKFSVYHQLGRLETEDQLKAARYLKELCYLNPDEFSIYGASYGGYMAGLVGEDDELLFSKSISQSPVSDWLYYDSIYTERYMGTPSTNPTGYTVMNE